MWTNPTYNVKCPRSDCLHFKTAAGDFPCGGCTCNNMAEGLVRQFRYEPKQGKERKDAE